MRILRLFKKIYLALEKNIEFIKYDPYTIAEYFRKQGAKIGDDCFINIKAIASEPFLVKIGNHVGIAEGVSFLTHSLGWNYRDKVPDLQVFGKIVIDDNCNIGRKSIILPNVTIGENTVMAALTGIAGSVKIGRDCMFGGQVGIAGHIEIADEVKMAAKSGIAKSIKKKGAVLMGGPAFDFGDYQKSYVYFKNLPKLADRIAKLEKRNLDQD